MLNSAIQSLGVYASRSIARSVEGNAQVISLSIGEPEFGPPPTAVEQLEELMRTTELLTHLKRYEQSLGSTSLRLAIARYYQRYFALAVDPEKEILITHGGAGALAAAILATTKPGDEVLVGDPAYMLYERIIVVLGRVPRRVARESSQGYRFDLPRIKAAIGPKTAALIVNSPENPIGYVCPDIELSALTSLCSEHEMNLIHDEVYDQFNFLNSHRPAGAFSGFDNVVQINSMSKKFGVPGLRLGWLVSNAVTVAVAARAQDYTQLSVNSFNEKVAEVLFGCADQAEWFTEIRNTLRKRVTIATERLGAIEGIDFPFPASGGMFIFPTVSGFAERLKITNSKSAGEAVADWLFQQVRIAVVPGLVYGPHGANSIRLVLSGPQNDLEKALTRIEDAEKAINGSHVN